MAFRDLGNCSSARIGKTVERIEHYSNRGPSRVKDKTNVQTKSGTITIVMDEITDKNLALALLGEVQFNSSGEPVVAILSEDVIAAKVKIVGNTDQGHNITVELNRVEFGGEGGDFDLIGEDYGTLEIVGEILDPGTGFGTATFPGLGSAGPVVPSVDNYFIGRGVVSIELITA